MKSLKDIITEALHQGPMYLGEIIYAIDKEYNITWLAAKEYAEIGKFLPYSKIEDMDVEKSMADSKCAISITAGRDAKSFGLGLQYIDKDGDLRMKDWVDMSKDTLQNLTICLRKILNGIDIEIEKEYTNHPNHKYMEIDIKDMVSDNTPRNFYLRNIKVGTKVRELTRDDKKAGFSWIIDIEINPDNPQQRLSIGIDKNDCLRWAWQTIYGDCKKGFDTPQHLIKWNQVEGKIATMLSSY